MTRQAEVRTQRRKDRERERESQAAPGTALSGSQDSKAVKDHSLSHSLIHSFHRYWVLCYMVPVLILEDTSEIKQTEFPPLLEITF